MMVGAVIWKTLIITYNLIWFSEVVDDPANYSGRVFLLNNFCAKMKQFLKVSQTFLKGLHNSVVWWSAHVSFLLHSTYKLQLHSLLAWWRNKRSHSYTSYIHYTLPILQASSSKKVQLTLWFARWPTLRTAKVCNISIHYSDGGNLLWCSNSFFFRPQG